MRQRTWEARVEKILGKELTEPLRWHYLSFADEKFNGAVILQCHGVTDGVMQTHALGINPGGQVMAVPMPDEVLPAEQYRNRLLTKEDILEIWPDAKTIREHEEEELAGKG